MWFIVLTDAEKKSIQSSKYSGTGSRGSGNRSRPHTAAKATGHDAVAKKKREMKEQVSE